MFKIDTKIILIKKISKIIYLTGTKLKTTKNFLFKNKYFRLKKLTKSYGRYKKINCI